MKPWVALVGLLAAGCSGPKPEQFAAEIERRVAQAPDWVEQSELGRKVWAIEHDFYSQRAYTPAWIEGDSPTAQLDELIALLQAAGTHGLNPERYAAGEIVAARARANEQFMGAAFEEAVIPEIELRATYAFLLHAADLLGWNMSSREIDRQWLSTPVKEDLGARLSEAIEKDAVRQTLQDLTPAHEQYRGLQAALKRGDTDPRIAMNLQRWRWAPRDLGERHILVNVPSYMLQAVEDQRPVLSMRVIVGAPRTPTPLFSDQMTTVVFSPYWNIPDTILREETLPKVIDDPDYLRRNNLEIVGTSGKGVAEVVDAASIDWSDEDATDGMRFRQAPGPQNALGLVKFIFPNPFDVYLHDTPGDRLFNRPKRPLSHGCIRVEQPVTLAQYVLRDRTEWDTRRITAAMGSGREQGIALKKPLPVHIGYWTAWVQADGSVAFFDDPYKFDAAQARLESRAARPL